STGRAGERGDWGEPTKWPSVRVPVASWRSAKDFGMGTGWIRAVVQTPGSGGLQNATRGVWGACGGIACERASDESGWDRCFKVEARAALRTRSAKQQIKKLAKKKTKTAHKIITREQPSFCCYV